MQIKLKSNAIELTVIAVYFLLSFIIINAYSELIFDEVWYINAARTFLDNRMYERPEHPPLAQMLITLNVSIFGDRPLGWRLFSIISSCILLHFFYKLVRDQTSNAELALSSMIVLSVNKLYFTFSMLGVLDIFMMFFFVLSIFFIFKERYTESFILMAMSAACKLTVIFYIPIIISCMIIQYKKNRNRSVRTLLKKSLCWIAGFSSIFLLLLFLLDLLFAGFLPQTISNPGEHLFYMFGTHVSSNWPTGLSEKPWIWLIRQNNYYLGNLSIIKDHYLESTSVIITGLSIVALPYALYKRNAPSLFFSIWLMNTYLIWFPAYFLLERPIFNFYLLPALPAISVLNCMFFNENRIILWSYTSLCIAFFVLFQFPINIL